MGQDRGAITRNRSAVWTRTGVLSPEAGVQFGSGQGCHHQRPGCSLGQDRGAITRGVGI